MSLQGAVKALGGDLEDHDYKPPANAVRLPTPQQAPDISWQRKALQVVQIMRDNLWSAKGRRAMDYLRKRGLSEGSIEGWELGYSSGQKVYGLWVPRGIVIPCYSQGRFWYLKVRRPKGDPKYKKVAGSRSGLFGADTVWKRRKVFVVEGEFDAMLLYQHVLEFAGVVTPGSATDRLDPARWGRVLLPVQKLIAVYDRDAAGQKGYENLSRLSGRIVRGKLPGNGEAKDITDFWKEGGDLHRWSKFQIERFSSKERV